MNTSINALVNNVLTNVICVHKGIYFYKGIYDMNLA